MRKKVISILIAAIAVGNILAGCGSSGDYSSKATESYTNDYYAAEDYAVSEEAAYDYDYDSNGGDIYEPKFAGEEAEGESISDDEVAASSNRKLIKTVNLNVETKEFDKLIANISNKITQLGGYAESTNINGNSYGNDDYYSRRSAYIVARIPAKNLDSFVSSVEESSNITNKTESAEDVTLQYSDVKARIDSLKVEQVRLNELLADADSLETIIALEQRMTEVRYELESYESRLRTMDNQVDYSTIYIDINEVKEYKPEPVEDPTFGERLAEEFTDSCVAAWEAIQNFIIGFVAFLPILLVMIVILGIVGGIIFLIVRIVISITKKSSKNKLKKKEKSSVVQAKVVESKPEANTDNSEPKEK